MTDQQIFKLKIHRNQLFTGTSQGLVSFDIYSGLERSGNYMRKSSVPTFVILRDNAWLISANFGSDNSSSNIYKSTDRGNSWFSYTNGFGGSRKVIPHTMDAVNETPSAIFARPASLTNVARSTNGGESWDSVIGSWENPNFGTSSFVKIDPYYPKRVWAGGATAYFRPTLLKSVNNGKDWKGLVVIENVETTVYDVATNPSNPDRVLAGLGIGIRKSTDGGETWETVLEGINTRTFTHSVSDPAVVYASGINAQGTLFFAASGDFGNTWEIVEMDDSPAGVQVNDMVSVMEDGREVLYFGTNKGVFSYTFEE
jgi:photosystem II stability/assembly factor-like uncharacterized protein